MLAAAVVGRPTVVVTASASPRPSAARARVGLPAAGAAAGALLVLASPPVGWGWLAWLAPAPLFWALLVLAERGSRARGAFAVGFAFGFTELLLLVPWFGAFSAAGYPVAAAYWGLLAGLVFLPVPWLLRRLPPTWAPPVPAAAWVLMEWLRTQGTLSFPWGSLAVTQHAYLPIIQGLDLTGAFGLSLLMALAAAAIAQATRARAAERNRTARSALGWLGIAGVLVTVSIGRGLLVLAQAPEGVPVRVGIVQSSESVRDGIAVRCISPAWEYDDRAREAMAEGVELLVWPETARPSDVVHSGAERSAIAALLEGRGVHLLTGSFVDDPTTGQVQNAAVMFSPAAEVLALYAKVLIVPFGEYLPLRPWLGWTERLGMPETDTQAGREWNPLPWARGSVGVSICFESAFGAPSRAHVRRGANLLAVLTSDGWAGRTAAGYQHAAFAPLRAVECRRSIVRAAATGISSLIDPQGRPIESLGMFRKGYLTGELPLRTDLTLHSRVGDWPVALAALVLLLSALRARRRARATPE